MGDDAELEIELCRIEERHTLANDAFRLEFLHLAPGRCFATCRPFPPARRATDCCRPAQAAGACEPPSNFLSFFPLISRNILPRLSNHSPAMQEMFTRIPRDHNGDMTAGGRNRPAHWIRGREAAHDQGKHLHGQPTRTRTASYHYTAEEDANLGRALSSAR